MQSPEHAGLQQALLMNEFEIGKPSTGRREGVMEASKDRGGRQSGMSWLGAWSKPGGRDLPGRMRG